MSTKDWTSRKLKKVGIKGGVKATPKIQKLEKLPIPGKPKGTNISKALTVQPMLKSIVEDRIGGMTISEIAKKYSVSVGYLEHALGKAYISNQIGKEVLKSNLLENSIACAVHTRTKIEELTPMQAAVATGIFASRFVELDKHTQATGTEIDFSQIADIGESLKDLRKLVSDDSEGKIIDI